MPIYYENKSQAEAAATVYEEYWDYRVNLEPYNGWVITLSPKSAEVFKYPLYDLAKLVDLDLGRVHCRPDDYKKPEPVAAKASSSSGGGGTPRSGATAQVHAIADKMHAEEPLDRADRARVIQACVDAGINKSTAATQWSKWAKKNGV